LCTWNWIFTGVLLTTNHNFWVYYMNLVLLLTNILLYRFVVHIFVVRMVLNAYFMNWGIYHRCCHSWLFSFDYHGFFNVLSVPCKCCHLRQCHATDSIGDVSVLPLLSWQHCFLYCQFCLNFYHIVCSAVWIAVQFKLRFVLLCDLIWLCKDFTPIKLRFDL